MSVLIPCILMGFLFPLLAKLKFRTQITVKEIALQGVIMSGICSVLYFAGTYSQLSDIQVLNGQVTKKYDKVEDCPSGWTDYMDSFCSNYDTRRKYTHTTCSTTNKVKSCTKHYKTQYNYDYDWEKRWYVQDTFTTHEISRVNKRGDVKPNRYSKVKVGDPASTTQRYDNYLKAAAHNIINPNKGVMELYQDKVPEYPSKITDYYVSNKVLLVGSSVKDLAGWNLRLAEELRLVSPKKQANIVLIITSIQDPMYKYAVEEQWLGGKKNDVVVLVGEEKGQIRWVDTITLGGNVGNELMTVRMRDSVLAHKTLDISVVTTISSVVMKHFDRKAMKDFEYLKESIQPPTWLIWTCYILSLVMGAGLTFYFIENETV